MLCVQIVRKNDGRKVAVRWSMVNLGKVLVYLESVGQLEAWKHQGLAVHRGFEFHGWCQ